MKSEWVSETRSAIGFRSPRVVRNPSGSARRQVVAEAGHDERFKEESVEIGDITLKQAPQGLDDVEVRVQKPGLGEADGPDGGKRGPELFAVDGVTAVEDIG